jgi:hypothetical protein
VCGVRTLFRPHPQPLSHCVGEGRRAQCFWSAEAPASAWAEASLPHSIIPLSRPAGEGDKADKGTSLEFTVCGVRTLFRPHPQPLSHSVGEERRARCFWSAEAPASAWAEASLPHSIIPLSRPAGEGDKGGEGNTARLPVHACAGKNSPRFKDFVPNRCTLTRPYGGRHPLTFATPHGGEPDPSRLNAWFSASRRCRISRRASGETVKRVCPRSFL